MSVLLFQHPPKGNPQRGQVIYGEDKSMTNCLSPFSPFFESPPQSPVVERERNRDRLLVATALKTPAFPGLASFAFPGQASFTDYQGNGKAGAVSAQGERLSNQELMPFSSRYSLS